MSNKNWSRQVADSIAPTSLEALLEDLNYMNLKELHGFCRERGIAYKILLEAPEGPRSSGENDRKAIVLGRVRAYLETGKGGAPTVFPADVIAERPLPERLSLSDKLYYGWYDKHDPAVLDVLARATNGSYKNGAVARILMRSFWSSGVAPTFAEFGSAWQDAEREGLGVAEGKHPEAAWLTDRARGTAGKDWKAKRERIARRALALLAKVPRPK